jgi:hypothetical protein
LKLRCPTRRWLKAPLAGAGGNGANGPLEEGKGQSGGMDCREAADGGLIRSLIRKPSVVNYLVEIWSVILKDNVMGVGGNRIKERFKAADRIPGAGAGAKVTMNTDGPPQITIEVAKQRYTWQPLRAQLGSEWNSRSKGRPTP